MVSEVGKGDLTMPLLEDYVNLVRKVREENVDKFYTLFDGGKNFKDARTHADKTFVNLMLPHAQKHLIELDKSLDVGFGSGLQVISAAHYFQRAFGIDVHEEGEFILLDLASRGYDIFNMNLHTAPADQLPHEDNLFDFVHSWVVFLHFPTIEYVEKVLSEIYRVLKPKGVAVIYYPRLVKSKRRETPQEYSADLEIEKQDEKGFTEKGSLTQVFKAGILLSQWKMSDLVTRTGFEILEHTYSHDVDASGQVWIYGQHGIVLRKPDVVESKPVVMAKKRLLPRKKKITKKEVKE